MSSEDEERAAAGRAGFDYDALALASMMAQYMRGTAPQLHELPDSTRMLVVAYQARMDGMLGIAVDQRGRRLPQVTKVDRTRYQRRALEAEEIIEGEVLDEDPAGPRG